jgi:RNA polymerase sigma-70 factor (ECF subfamily)
MPADALVMEAEAAVSAPEPQDAASRAVLRVRAGDREAFGELMALTEQRVLRLAWRMLGDREQARDAAQEAFLRAYRSLGGFRVGEHFPAWMARIAVNVCLDHLRRRGPVHLELQEAPGPAEAGTCPEEALLQRERRDLVRRSLERLPQGERSALVLRDLEGYGTEEAARLLGVKPATVRSQACLARRRILAFLKGEEA